MDLTELRIEIERARHETVRVEFVLPPDALDLTDDPEYLFSAPIRGQFSAHMIHGEAIHLRGEISTEARAACVRCLEQLAVPISAEVDLMFFPEPSAFDRRRFAQLEDDEKVYYAGDFVHPGEQLREELLVNLPFVPACELEAGDICPVRGTKVEVSVVKGDPAVGEKSPAVQPETGNSLAAQLARVRKQMEKE